MQELQADGLMIPKMAFQLSGKLLALHLDNNNSKAYLGNQGGTASTFFPD